jgi:hypothetical protein
MTVEISNPFSKTQLAPGGSLAEYAKCLRARKQPCLSSTNGQALWVPGSRGELMRMPVTYNEPPSRVELRRVLGQKGIFVASYLVRPDDDRPADTFFYVCRERSYEMGDLKKRTRAAVRKGLKELDVRLCTWDELAEKGYPAYADTDERHGYPVPSREDFASFLEQRRDSPFLDIWGAWAGEDLAGWLTVLKVGDWAWFDAAKSATAYLSQSPNNALYFLITHTMLVDEGRSWVSSGLSTVQAGVDPLSLHRFKLRMRHAPERLRRVFVPHWALRPVVGHRLAASVWTALARAFPKYGLLGKIAGLARSVCGTRGDALAWADDQDK